MKKRYWMLVCLILCMAFMKVTAHADTQSVKMNVTCDFDGSDYSAKVTWDPVPGATVYSVYVMQRYTTHPNLFMNNTGIYIVRNGMNEVELTAEHFCPESTLGAGTSDYVINVYAYANEEARLKDVSLGYGESESFKCEMPRLDKPTNLRFSNSSHAAVASWNSVDGADSYKVELYLKTDKGNEREFGVDVSGTSYDFSNYIKIPYADYFVRVQAVDTSNMHHSSVFAASESVSFNSYPNKAITSVTLSGNDFPAPVAGEKPKRTTNPTYKKNNFTITTAFWADVEDWNQSPVEKFEIGHSYELILHLKADENYQFTRVSEMVSFSYLEVNAEVKAGMQFDLKPDATDYQVAVLTCRFAPVQYKGTVSKVTIHAYWGYDCTKMMYYNDFLSSKGSSVSGIRYILFGKEVESVVPGDTVSVGFLVKKDEYYQWADNVEVELNYSYTQNDSSGDAIKLKPGRWIKKSDNERWYEFDAISVPQPVAPPDGLSISLDENGKPIISWNSVAIATEYEIGLLEYKGKIEIFTVLSKTDRTTYTHTDAEYGNTYAYAVRAWYYSVHGSYSKSVSVTVNEPAGKHTYPDEWKSDESSHWKECIYCHNKEYVGLHTGGTATCLAKAKCSECGAEYGPLAGHIYGKPVFEWKDLTSAKAVFTCLLEETHTDSADAVITSEITKAATVAEEGIRTYTATVTFEGKKYTDTKTESIPKLQNPIPGGSGDTPGGNSDPDGNGDTPGGNSDPDGNGDTPTGDSNLGGSGDVNEILPGISSVELSTKAYTYNGKTKKPSVIVKDTKGNVVDAQNYTVKYPSGRKNVGVYTVKVTFKGTYSGTVNVKFTINPAKTSIKSLKAAKKSLTVKWTKKTTQVTGYEVQYSTSKTFKSGNKTVKITSNKTTSKQIKKLKSKKTYYVRIRTYKTVNGKKYYSDWSSVKKIKVK